VVCTGANSILFFVRMFGFGYGSGYLDPPSYVKASLPVLGCNPIIYPSIRPSDFLAPKIDEKDNRKRKAVTQSGPKVNQSESKQEESSTDMCLNPAEMSSFEESNPNTEKTIPGAALLKKLRRRYTNTRQLQ